MPHNETTVHSSTLYQGKILDLKLDQVQLENGAPAQREVVVHHGGVCVAALDHQDRLLLVRQFRYAHQRELLELPAGKREQGEDPRLCGIRELEEETGFRAQRFEKLGEIYPTPAYCTEIIHLYYATGLVPAQQRLDQGEFLTVEKVPFHQAVEMALAGKLPDAKTQTAILRLCLLRQQGRL